MELLALIFASSHSKHPTGKPIDYSRIAADSLLLNDHFRSDGMGNDKVKKRKERGEVLQIVLRNWSESKIKI
jgi:hypothetical protein